MSDKIQYLPESRSYFRDFVSERMTDLNNTMINSRTGRKSGYPTYYRDGEIADYINNIVGNLEERFGNLTIPKEFSSPKQLVTTWTRFYDYIRKSDKIFESVKEKYKSNTDKIPYPFWDVYQVHEDIKDMMEEILNMDEVNAYLPGSIKPDLAIERIEPKAQPVLKQDCKEKDILIHVAIITALFDTEFEALKNLPCDFSRYDQPNDSTLYYIGKIESKNVLIATDNKMGMAASASLATKIIAKFSPQYIIMAGIAAGVKDDKKQYGDIMVANWTFNYESGKYEYDENTKLTTFQPNPEPIELDATILREINEFKSKRSLLNSIKASFVAVGDDKVSERNLKVIVGPIASGSAVVGDGKKIEAVRAHQRKLIGIDMETFGVYHAAKSFSITNSTKAISIKSISDFADQEKSDFYRNYAAHTSANFIYHLIKESL